MLKQPGKEIWVNDLMKDFLEGVELGSYRDLSWLSAVPRSGWAGDLDEVARTGWLQTSSGALVLGRGIPEELTEAPFADLSYLETRANRFYIPAEGMDVSSEQALGELAGRGYALVSKFLADLPDELRSEPVVGIVSVARGFEERADGTYTFFRQRGSNSDIDVAKLDDYPAEGMLAVVFGPDCTEEVVELPAMALHPKPEPSERAVSPELLDLANGTARQVATTLQQAGYHVALGEPLGAQGGVAMSISDSGRIFLGWKATAAAEEEVDDLMMAGDMLHPAVEELANTEHERQESIKSLLERSGFHVGVDPSRELTEKLEVHYF